MAKLDGLLTNPMVAALYPDPDGERRAALVGFAGPSNVDGKVRLYTDLSFKTYFEFPVAAIVLSQLAKAGDDNGPTVVVLDPKAQVDKVTVERTSGDAAFLSGDISGTHYASAQPFGAFGGGAAQGADCACVFASMVGSTLLAAAPQPDCACVLLSVVGSTLLAAAPQPDCACVLLSVVGSTLAGAQGAVRGPNCCHPTYSAATCTRDGPSMVAPPPAAMDCLKFMNTTVCTPTGVPYLCPAG